MDTLDLTDLATKALRAKSDHRWWVRILVGIAVVIGAWFTKRAIDKSRSELFQEQEKAKQEQLNALIDQTKARKKEIRVEREAHEAKAREAFVAARSKLKKLNSMEAELLEYEHDLSKVKEGDWETLNKLAGVK